MPIYAYKCSSCGAAQDILRKISDPPLTICPACGQEGLSKQVTAAGFQLKGSGWYVTDFRDGTKTSAPAAADANAAQQTKADTANTGASDTAATSANAASATPTASAPSSPGAAGVTSAAPTTSVSTSTPSGAAP